MESWRKVWRKGIVPLLSNTGLEFLREGLLKDDPRILQGATTAPPPLMCVQDWPVEACCVIGYTGVGDFGGFHENVNDNPSVEMVEEYFARMCYEIDLILGEPAACRWFINWSDESPRHEMRIALLSEVQLALRNRQESI